MLPFTTIRQLQLEVRTHPDLAEVVLRRARSLVEAWEPWIRAFVYLDWTLAEQNLKEASPLGWLWPAPIGIKDLADVRDMPTTGSSRAYRWIAQQDAPAVARLREAGAVILGKTNTQELAYGVITPPTRNPWNLEHIPGGSSGGTAAAVAAGVISAGLGTDTGGSIRIPAACCGVVGFKPGYGRIPLDGIMALAPTLDHVGPITRTVEEAAWCYRIMAGEPDPLRPLKTAPGWLRLGVPWEYIEQAMAAPVASNLRDCLELLKELGFALEPFALDPWPNWLEVQMAIRGPESYRVHREVLTSSRRELLTPALAERLEQGQRVAGADYLQALATRQLWIHRYREQFDRQRLDAVVMPTLPVPAPRVGEETVEVGGKRLGVWETLIRFTAPWNLLGFPAISLPSGFTESGLPLGLQLVGLPGHEEALLALAHRLELAGMKAAAPPNPPAHG